MRMVLSPILKLWQLSAVGSKLLLFLSGDASTTLASEPEQSAGGSHFELSGDASAPLEREPYQKAPECTRMYFLPSPPASFLLASQLAELPLHTSQVCSLLIPSGYEDAS